MQEMDQQLRRAVKQTQQENIKLYISHYIADSFLTNYLIKIIAHINNIPMKLIAIAMKI